MPKVGIREPCDLFAALSDRTRLRLLNLLRDGEKCVCDLVDGIGAPQPTISRHLSLLRSAGLVAGRREGVWIHYRLEESAADLLEKLFACLSEGTLRCPEFPSDQKRMRASRKARGCCD